jgi:hypothetical protein
MKMIDDAGRKAQVVDQRSSGKERLDERKAKGGVAAH